MFTIGCLALIVLPLAGLALGGFVAGPEGAKWGAIGGFAIALALTGVTTYALVSAARRR